MFIKNNENLPPNVIWIKEEEAKNILNFFPEISRRINEKDYIEIAFSDTTELRDKLIELKINY